MLFYGKEGCNVAVLTERSVYRSNIKLTSESCFDLLPTIPDNSVSLVLIDPPYDILPEFPYIQELKAVSRRK